MTDYLVPNNAYDNYWGPAQVRLFVDGVWVDDACAVQYNIEDRKIPKYGYFDRFYRTIAVGQTLVSGRLSIQFRYNGYLRSAIEDQLLRRSDFKALTEPGGVNPRLNVQDLEDMKDRDEDEQVDLLTHIAHAPAEEREKKFGQVKDMLWGFGDDTSWEGLRPSPLEGPKLNKAITTEAQIEKRSYQRPGLFTQGFDIMLVYGTDPSNKTDPGLLRVIQDVHLVGEAQVVQIEVPDGSRAVREVYTFIARDIRAGDPLGSVPSSGGALAG